MVVLDMSIAAALIIVIIAVVRYLTFKRMPKVIFLIGWGMALTVLLVRVPFSLSFAPSTAVQTLTTAHINVQPTAQTFPHVIHSHYTTHTPTLDVGTATYAVQTPALTTTPNATESFAWVRFVMPIWIFGMTGLAIYIAATHLRHRKLYSVAEPLQNAHVNRWLDANSIHRNIVIRVSDMIHSPLTYGVFRPIILLPKSLDLANTQQVEHILTHELTHIRRYDALYKLLLAVALCVHWFNPMVWFMYVLANRDIEFACDEAVVRRLGYAEKRNYAKTLLDFMKPTSITTPLATYFLKQTSAERIETIMTLRRRTTFNTLLALLFILIVGLGVLVVHAQPAADTPAPTPTPTYNANATDVSTVHYTPSTCATPHPTEPPLEHIPFEYYVAANGFRHFLVPAYIAYMSLDEILAHQFRVGISFIYIHNGYNAPNAQPIYVDAVGQAHLIAADSYQGQIMIQWKSGAGISSDDLFALGRYLQERFPMPPSFNPQPHERTIETVINAVPNFQPYQSENGIIHTLIPAYIQHMHLDEIMSYQFNRNASFVYLYPECADHAAQPMFIGWEGHAQLFEATSYPGQRIIAYFTDEIVCRDNLFALWTYLDTLYIPINKDFAAELADSNIGKSSMGNTVRLCLDFYHDVSQEFGRTTLYNERFCPYAAVQIWFRIYCGTCRTMLTLYAMPVKWPYAWDDFYFQPEYMPACRCASCN